MKYSHYHQKKFYLTSFLKNSQPWYTLSFKIFALATAAAVAAADKAPAPSYGYKPAPAPYHAPAPAPYHAPAPAPAYKAHPAPVYADEPPKYVYEYGVADDYSHANFGHTESRDGYATKGSYRVALPDGRTQIVTYSADENGYVADVKYEGVAKYPEAKAYHPAPAPVYHAAPTYKPAPVAPAPAAEEKAE